MIGKSILTLFAASITFSNAQISSGPDDTVTCTGGGNAYCAADSLTTNIIIRCSGTKGQPGNCNDNLAFIPPVGVKTAALCYQTTPTSGDAACSFNGIVYPDTGSPFPINGTSNSTTSSTSASASIPTAPGPVIPITMTIATAPGLPTGLSASSGVSPRALSTISTGGYVPYSTGGAPYPIVTSTKIMTPPTAGTGGATGVSTGAGTGATSDPDPSTSPITSSSAGVVVVVRRTSVEMVVVGVVVGVVVALWM
ncbi:MAG: hypothetical protein OHK93_007876 [Ramalina farinacea]|uniref:Uncharacterized protein n=1 Tax=Ramalina farinacea TaxID=258253 RepID=A0AA43QLC4_9LECA|nr:hypothetical protein [Ramalina farinacea]